MLGVGGSKRQKQVHASPMSSPGLVQRFAEKKNFFFFFTLTLWVYLSLVAAVFLGFLFVCLFVYLDGPALFTCDPPGTETTVLSSPLHPRALRRGLGKRENHKQRPLGPKGPSQGPRWTFSLPACHLGATVLLPPWSQATGSVRLWTSVLRTWGVCRGGGFPGCRFFSWHKRVRTPRSLESWCLCNGRPWARKERQTLTPFLAFFRNKFQMVRHEPFLWLHWL